MGRFVSGLILVIIVSTATQQAHAQTTPEEHTVHELEIKSKALIVSGSFITSIGGAFMIPDGALIGVQYADKCETCGPSAPTALIAGSILLGIGALTLVPGAILLAQGIKKKKKVVLLASGEATIEEVGESEYLGPVTGKVPPAYIDLRMGKVRSMVRTGNVLVSLSLASAAAGWIFWAAYQTGEGYRPYSLDLGFLILTPFSVLMYAVGSPYLLMANIRARHLVGLKPSDGLGIAGWVLYGNALSTGSIFFGGPPPYLAIAYSASLIAGAVVSLVAGVRAAKIANEQMKTRPGSITLVPSISPLPGGVSIGVAGSF